MTLERSDVPDERLCDASERFARFASTSMQVPVLGPCIMRTRCVSVDCRQRYPSEISTWYWFCPPAARGASCSPSSSSRCISAHLARRARHLGASRRILLAQQRCLPWKTVLAAPLPGTFPLYTRETAPASIEHRVCSHMTPLHMAVKCRNWHSARPPVVLDEREHEAGYEHRAH